MSAGEIVQTIAALAFAGISTTAFIIWSADDREHTRAIKRRLREIGESGGMISPGDWGDRIELPAEARRGAAQTRPGEGASIAAHAQGSHCHIAHDDWGFTR